MIKENNISIVVIGRNEAYNLDQTFQAILSINYPKDNYELIYVDTNSTDNSVEIANKYTDKVFIEKREWSTPGLARNRGLVEAKNEIIHFIDGDIIIDKDYIKYAVAKMQEDNIDAVYGFLLEKSSKGVNDLLLTHWKSRVEGYHNATGGGGTYKKSALLSINGYDERIRKGQETEMGERFLKAGCKIWFMDKKMGEHDYGVKKVKDLLWIYYIDGVNKSHLHLTKGNSDFYQSSKKSAFNNLVFFVGYFTLIGFLLVLFGAIGIVYSILLYYFYFIFKFIILKRNLNKIDIKYNFMLYSMKIVVLYGQIEFYIKCLLKKGYYAEVIKKKDVLLNNAIV